MATVIVDSIAVLAEQGRRFNAALLDFLDSLGPD